MKGIDFTQLQKETLETTLKNGIKIHVLPPNVKACGKMQNMNTNDFNGISRVLSEILSHNQECYDVSKEDIETYDTQELMMLAQSILEFVSFIQNQKH